MATRSTNLLARATTGLAIAGSLVATQLGCVSLAKYNELQAQFERQERHVIENQSSVARAEHGQELARTELQRRERELIAAEQRLKGAEDALVINRRHLEEERAAQLEQPSAAAASQPVWSGETTAFVLDGALFRPGLATLSNRGYAEVDAVAGQLQDESMRHHHVRIEGHTDDTPIRRSGFQDNWNLSAQRARAVVLRLIERGVDAERLSCAGYGPHRPRVAGKTEAARARNRRVEIVLTPAPAGPTYGPAVVEDEGVSLTIEEPAIETDSPR